MLNSTFLCTNGLKIPSSSSKKYNTWSKCYWYPLLILLRKKYISFHWWYRTLVHTLLIIAYQLLKNLAVAGSCDVIKIWLIYQDRQKFSCIYVVNWCVPCVETGVFPLVLSVYIVILDPLEHILPCFRKMIFDRSSPLTSKSRLKREIDQVLASCQCSPVGCLEANLSIRRHTQQFW